MGELLKARQPTLLHRKRGSLVLLVHSLDAPHADDWSEYIAALRGYVKDPACAILVLAGSGPGPSPLQRQMLADFMPKRVRTVVVTDSVLARGIVTLLSWFHENIRAHSPAAIEQSFEYVGVPGVERPLVLRVLAAMRAQLHGFGVESDVAAFNVIDAAKISPMEVVCANMDTLRDRLAPRRARPSAPPPRMREFR